jgi:hypothetical protein
MATAGLLLMLLTTEGQHPPVGPNDPQFVSLLQLICNPEKYDGKLISVVGFLHLERGGDLLYHSEEDYKHGIAENAVWIERNDEVSAKTSAVDLKYVTVIGVFSFKTNPLARCRNHRPCPSNRSLVRSKPTEEIRD